MADPSEEHRDLHEVLDSDTQGISVTWSGSNADNWRKNLIRARCEGWFATSVYSPLGVVSCDLTA